MFEIKEVIIKHYGLKMDAPTLSALRQLVADGLTVTEEVTPVMTEIGKALGIRQAETPTERLIVQTEGR